MQTAFQEHFNHNSTSIYSDHALSLDTLRDSSLCDENSYMQIKSLDQLYEAPIDKISVIVLDDLRQLNEIDIQGLNLVVLVVPHDVMMPEDSSFKNTLVYRKAPEQSSQSALDLIAMSIIEFSNYGGLISFNQQDFKDALAFSHSRFFSIHRYSLDEFKSIALQPDFIAQVKDSHNFMIMMYVHEDMEAQKYDPVVCSIIDAANHHVADDSFVDADLYIAYKKLRDTSQPEHFYLLHAAI